jgi:hypothetical protein
MIHTLESVIKDHPFFDGLAGAQCLRSKCELDHDLGYEMLKRFATAIVERLDAAQVQLLDVYART